MNKKLPYEEMLAQQLNNLPLPDEGASWQKMQELLDEKKRRPFFLYTDNSKSVLTLLLLLGFLVVVHSSRHERTTGTSAKTKKYLQADPPAFQPAPDHPAGSKETDLTNGSNSSANPSATGDVHTYPLTPARPASATGFYHTYGKTNQSGSKTTRTAVLKNPVAHRRAGQNKQGSVTPERRIASPGLVVASMQLESIHPVTIAGIIQNHGVSPEIFPDPTLIKQTRQLVQKGLPGEQHGFSKLSSRPLFISAGVGVQQSIPVGGQKQVSFNLNGQKNLFSDYIPSLFLRLEKDCTWYLQAEFSYATPRLVNDFSYSRQTRADTAQTITTNLLLKKVFYRELPFSFNYYLRPHWTVGAGATYSWFQGAITEKQTATRNLQNPTGFVAKQIVPIERYTDSFLYRSHSYLLLQTNYQWQSLSLGLRFSKDVQPYIKYTLPDGTVADKRNWSLELLVRLGLWKSAGF